MTLIINNCVSLLLVSICVYILPKICAQGLPGIACPQYFQYVYERGRYFGEFVLPKLTENFTKLDVQFSQETRITDDYYGRISLLQRQSDIKIGDAVTYRIEFPTPYEVPRLERLTINNRDICLTEDYELLRSNMQTIYLQHNLSYSLHHAPPPVPLLDNTINDQYGRIQPSAPTVTFQTYPTTQRQRNQQPTTMFRPIVAPTTPGLPSRNDRRFEQPQETPLEMPPSQRQLQAQQQQFITLPTQVPNRRTTIPAIVQPEARLSSESNCGRQIAQFSPFIFGGKNLTRGQLPWIVALYRKVRDGTKFLCGGTLISSRTVITAAHCVSNVLQLTPRQVLAYVGRYDLYEYDEVGARPHELSNFIVHPEFNVTTFADADLALLLLRDPVVFTEYVQPVCLWREPSESSLIVNQVGTIAGWGADETGRDITVIPKWVTAKIFTQTECRRERVYSNIVSSRTICAGNADGTGPCQGDSGGSIIMSRNGRWVLRGVLSGGAMTGSHCNLSKFVVYCDVAQHMDWILQNMLD